MRPLTAFSRLPAPGQGVVLRTAKRWWGQDGRPTGEHVLGRRGADAAPCGLHRPAGSVHAGLPVAGRILAGLRRSTLPILRNPRVMRLLPIMLLPLPPTPVATLAGTVSAQGATRRGGAMLPGADAQTRRQS